MRALICDRFGEPAEVLRLADAVPPEPARGTLVVRVRARAVNPSDLLTVRGTYAAATPLPLVPGFEGVGEVVEAGEGVPAGWLGRRVLALRGDGTWQERVRVPAVWAVPVPDAIPDAVAAQLYINPLSVLRMLTQDLTLAAGSTVAVNAAGSACGRIAAQLCRALGLRMIALTRSGAHAETLMALGAAAVVDAARGDPVAEIRRLTGGRGADAGLDAVGGASGAALAEALAPGATLLAYGLLSGSLLRTDLPQARARGVTVRRWWLKPWVDTCAPAAWHSAFADVFGRVVAGALTLEAGPVYDLSAAAAAIRAAEAPGRVGKVILAG